MIRTEKLSVLYHSNLALREVSLDVPRGSITAIVGPSGCGKSSFLSAINRMTDLIPGASMTGDVIVDCCNIHDACRSPVELRRCVGMIFQKPNPFPTSIQHNIQLALKEHGQRDSTALVAATRDSLQQVGLWEEVKDRLDASALSLSGGQQQRLCIARSIALNPQVLLMDEPCSALDPIAAAKVETLICELRGQHTIVIVTHNLAQARRIADHLAVFWVQDGAGELIEQGPTEAMFTESRNELVRAYLSGRLG